MDTKLIVEVSRLSRDGETIQGEVDAVDLDEEFVKSFGGIRYDLNLRLYGSELLVKGSLAQDFDLVCCRCGKDFDDTVKVDDFLVSQEVPADSCEVDLTEIVRESIILALPTYPICDEACHGIEAVAEKPTDDRWSMLDNLNK